MVSPRFQAVSLLRLQQVLERTGRSRSTTYKLISEGLWPRGVSVGARAVAWPSNEVDRLVHAYILGWNEERLRAEVRAIEQSRRVAPPESEPSSWEDTCPADEIDRLVDAHIHAWNVSRIRTEVRAREQARKHAELECLPTPGGEA